MNTRTVHSHKISGGAGITLFVEETGNMKGIPLVFVHGFSQSRLVWSKQVDSELADDFRIVTIDNRGHGLSDKPKDGYDNSKLWADDIHAVIKTLELDKPILIGWSYGGIILLDYLSHYGDSSIRGVNLVGARSRMGVKEATEETGEEYAKLKPLLFSNDVAESVRGLSEFIELCAVKKLSTKDFYFFLGFNVIVPPYVRYGLMNRSISNHELLLKLEVPFLVTHGVADQIVLFNHAKYNNSLIKNATTSFYEGVGHLPFWESHQRFNKDLRKFANSLI